MIEGRQKQDELAALIEALLQRPPSSAGRRLRSERDLAVLFDVDLYEIRQAIRRLVDDGVLVRRRGSGTFVRKVPTARRGTRGPANGHSPIEPAMLFAEPSQAAVNAQHPARALHQKRLRLGLWTDFGSAETPSRRLLVARIQHEVERAGHALTEHSLLGSEGTVLDVRSVSRLLQESPCDGYIVAAWLAELFLEAGGDNLDPVVYVSDSNVPVEHEPAVMIDRTEAIQHAIRLLADQGYTRIALIGHKVPEEPLEHLPLRRAYERAVEDAGLDFTGAMFTTKNAQDCRAAVRRVLAMRARPQAICVPDDYTMIGVAEALDEDEIVPGRDLGVISMGYTGGPLPPVHRWSRLTFDIDVLGRLAVDQLLALLQTADPIRCSLAVRAAWSEGETHLRNPRAGSATITSGRSTAT